MRGDGKAEGGLVAMQTLLALRNRLTRILI